MLLQTLAQRARQNTQPQVSYYALSEVHWLCHLSPKGTLDKWERLKADADESEKPRGLQLLTPTASRGNDVVPILFCDTAEYVVGCTGRDGKEARVADYHAAFSTLAQQCAEALPTITAVLAVRDFLKSKRSRKLPKNMLPGDRITFSVAGVKPVDIPEVQAFWKTRQGERIGGQSLAFCLVCGQPRQPMRVFNDRVKGVPLSLQKRCALVSANPTSTGHYGRESALVSPICEECASGSILSLNSLIVERAIQIGNMFVVCWSDTAKGFSVQDALLRPNVDTLKTLTTTLEENNQEPVHVLYLTARKAVGTVRGYRQSTWTELANNLRTWYSRQGDALSPLCSFTMEADPEDRKSRKRFVPGLLDLLARNNDINKLSNDYVVAICNSALFGNPLPLHVYRTAAQHTIFDGSPVNAVIAWLRLYHKEYDLNVIDSAPYRCGKLLSLLERIQRKAIPNISRTIADSWLRAASARPAIYLGQALTRAKGWLAKLEKNGPGALSAAIGAAVQGLEFPLKLTVAESANFCLGYYEGRAEK